MSQSWQFMLKWVAIVVAVFSMGGPGALAAEGPIDFTTMPAALVMIRDPGCPYCARWEREVAPGYEASEDGKLAPLVRRYRSDPDVAVLPRIVYSPTFVMLVRGKEVGRIVGYGGADLFWMQLAVLMEDVRRALRHGEVSAVRVAASLQGRPSSARPALR